MRLLGVCAVMAFVAVFGTATGQAGLETGFHVGIILPGPGAEADAIGAAESRDLADAYLGWFQIRARWAQAVFQWNVAVVRLDRATGEFHARGNRLKEK